jgi:hypothetical protein
MDRRRTRRLPVVENLGFSTTEPKRKKGTEAFFLVELERIRDRCSVLAGAILAGPAEVSSRDDFARRPASPHSSWECEILKARRASADPGLPQVPGLPGRRYTSAGCGLVVEIAADRLLGPLVTLLAA